MKLPPLIRMNKTNSQFTNTRFERYINESTSAFTVLNHVCITNTLKTYIKNSLFLDGKFIDSKTTEWVDLYNPVK